MANATPPQVAASILRGLGIHQTPGAIQGLVGWMRAEGGHWNNDARFNPLNTTQPAPGAGNTGTQGNIKVYRSWGQGIKATVETLTNGKYGGILAALRAGDPARVADAIGRSPWGTSASLARSAILGTPRVAGAHPLSGTSSGGTSGGAAPGAQVLVNAGGGGSSAGPDLSPGTNVTPAIAALLSAAQPQGPPVSLPMAPAHSAHAVMPQGYAPPSSSAPPVPAAPDVGALLDAVRTQAGGLPGSSGGESLMMTGAPLPGPSGGGASGASGASGAIVGTANGPTGRPGKIIGTPYTGTHTLGNWQSDRAYDIAVPKGTPMVALQDGTIVKVRRHPQDGGRFAGDQITVRGANGNEYFYAHGVASVKAGQRIRKGQQLGVTGSANGVDHLHFGQMRGDPSMHLRRHS